MLLDDLVTAIQTVQARIREPGNSLSQNEYRTRLALIDPILNALGWDVSDPSLVTPEYQAGNGRADYALLSPDAKPRAFIEAKRLNEPLEPHQDQVFKYTWDQKLFYGGLTDGNRWVLEDVTAAFSGREGRLLDITLTNETAYQCALKLLLLWHPTLATGQLIEANQPIIVTTPEPDPIIDPPPPDSGWISLTDYNANKGDKPPTIRVPEKGELEVRYWYQIIVETAEWLIRTGDLTASTCPIKGSTLHIRAVDDIPRRSYTHTSQLSNGLFLNIKKSINDVLTSTKFLMQRFHKDPSSILLKSS